MPTGYTAPVQDGSITTLHDFAMLCARGMGACLPMRDRPLGEHPPRLFTPSAYHCNKLVELAAKRDALTALTPDQATGEAAKARAAYDLREEGRRAAVAATKARYEAMIAKVAAWQGAPDGIKAFMLDQLNSSLAFDCHGDPAFADPPPPQTGEAWVQAELMQVAEDMAYHSREWANEIKRTAERNAWLTQLRASLKED